MGSIGVLILTDRAALDIETWEAEHLLAEDGEVLFVELGHEGLLGVAGVARILVAVLYGIHTIDECLLGDTEGLTEVEGVDMVACLVHHNHDVIGRLIIDEEFALAVVDSTARGKLYLLLKSVGIGTFSKIVTHNLEYKESHDIDEHYSKCYSANDVFTIGIVEIFHFFLLRRLSVTSMTKRVSTRLQRMLSNHCSQWASVKASRVNMMKQYTSVRKKE